MSTGKIRIKFGPIEVDCEGSEQFLKEEFLGLIQEISKLARESGVQMTGSKIQGDTILQTADLGDLKTTEAIAARLTVSSGTDLALAAGAKLTLIDGRRDFSRQDITNEMKTAKAYYKSTFTKNLSNSLKTLVTDKRFNPLGTSNYALSATEVTSLKSRL